MMKLNNPTNNIEGYTRVGANRHLAGVLILVLFAATLANAQQLFESSDVGMPAVVEKLYASGMKFLSRSQSENGTWGPDRYGTEPGVVGLAVVCMLAHGDNPNWGPYSANIRRSIDFLISQANSETGYIGQTMYNHGFATLALAEAYGEVDDDRIGPVLHKAVQLILNSQKKNPLGAWRYSPSSSDADTTATGCELVALFAARNAGIPVPEEAIRKGLTYMLNCQSEGGGVGYTSSQGPNSPRTAIGCLVWTLAKERNSPQWKAAFDYLKAQGKPANYYFYYLYYGSQAYFHASPEEWMKWNAQNIQELQQTQQEDGSWDGQFGATFSTATSLLSLALNYRYLPIYER